MTVRVSQWVSYYLQIILYTNNSWDTYYTDTLNIVNICVQTYTCIKYMYSNEMLFRCSNNYYFNSSPEIISLTHHYQNIINVPFLREHACTQLYYLHTITTIATSVQRERVGVSLLDIIMSVELSTNSVFVVTAGIICLYTQYLCILIIRIIIILL